MPTLSSPLLLPCGLTLPNRLAKSAMSENMADKGHIPGERFRRVYQRWGESGAGLLISGNVAVHQFNRVGRLAFVSGGSAVSTDVPPFCVAWGRNRLHGVNLVGMRRSGISRPHIDRVKLAFIRCFRASLPRPEMIAVLDELGQDCPPVQEMAQFVREAKKPICVGLGRPSRDLIALWRAVRSGKLDPAEDEPVA